MNTHADNKPSAFWRLLPAVAALAVALPAAAQNNPFKIDDQLYAVYQKATKMRYWHEGLQIADEMYRKAEAMGDRKAQCLALTLPVQYHYQIRTKDDTKFEAAVKRLQECSKKYGYIQYFYYAVSSRVNYLVAKKQQPSEALVYMEEMIEYARRNNHVYGIFSGLKDMAQFHRIHSENFLAIDNYRQAIELGNEYLPEQDMSPLYRRIAECYENIYDYDGMFYWAQSGLAAAKTKAARKSLVAKMAMAKFFGGDHDAFLRHYAEYGGIDSRTKDLIELEMLAAEAVCSGSYKRAYEAVKRIPDGLVDRKKVLLWMEVSRLEGDYKLIASNQRVYYRTRINNSDSVYAGGFGSIDSYITNLRIDYEHNLLESEHQRLENQRQLAGINNTKLELANTKLSLRNASLELARTRSNAEIMRLSLYRKRLETERLRGEIEAERAQKAIGDTFFTTCAALGAIMAIAILLYLRSRNRLLAKLEAANRRLERRKRQLTEAIDKIQTADRAKSAFIQNMGNDIRKPLENAVLSARLIATAHRKKPTQQLGTLNQELQSSTQTMLDIVADVLDKSKQL